MNKVTQLKELIEIVPGLFVTTLNDVKRVSFFQDSGNMAIHLVNPDQTYSISAEKAFEATEMLKKHFNVDQTL